MVDLLGDSPGVSSDQQRPSPDDMTQSRKQMRVSCEPCSAAKVKCDKRKPVCDRCQTRGRVCEYLRSRRCGRPPMSLSGWAIKKTPSIQVGSTSTKNSGRQSVHETPGPNQFTATSQSPTSSEDALYCDLQSLSSNAAAPLDTPDFFDNKGWITGPCSTNGSLLSASSNDHTPVSVLLSPGTDSMQSPGTATVQFASFENEQGFVQPSARSSAPLDQSCVHGRFGADHQTTPLMQSCDCVPRLLLVFTLAKADLPPCVFGTGFDSVNSKAEADVIFDVCSSVMTCPCLSYDERAVSLVTCIILYLLTQSKTDLLLGEHGSLSADESVGCAILLARQLAARLRTHQPEFHWSESNIFISFWLATGAW